MLAADINNRLNPEMDNYKVPERREKVYRGDSCCCCLRDQIFVLHVTSRAVCSLRMCLERDSNVGRLKSPRWTKGGVGEASIGINAGQLVVIEGGGGGEERRLRLN